MALWRAAAIERMPKLRETIDSAWNVMSLWIELWKKCEDAYEKTPRDDAVIAAIFSYADWCESAPRDEDASHDPYTALCVAFYEHLPDHPNSLEDMPRWFTLDDVERNREGFAYHIGDAASLKVVQYVRENQHRYIRKKRS